MAITYDSETETILVTGTGNTIDDIYQADVAGGWGVVTKTGDHQYLIEAHLDIGVSGTETELLNIGNQVTLGTEATPRWVRWNTDATFQIGDPQTDGYDTMYGAYGNSFIAYFSSEDGYIDCRGTFKVYNAYLTVNHYGNRWRIMGVIEFKNVIQNGIGNIFYYCAAGSTVERFSISTTNSYGLMCYTDNVEWNDVIIDNVVQGWVCGYGGRSPILTNAKIRVSDYERDIVMNPYNAGTFYAINCDYNIYAIRSYIDPEPHHHLMDYKTFNLKVVDSSGDPIENVAVKLTDNQGNITNLTTDENGEITETNLLNFDMVNNQQVGTGVGTEYNDYTFHTPYTMELSKAGLTTQTLIFDINEDKYKRGIQLQLSMDVPEVPTYEGISVDITEDNIEISIGG